MARPFWKGYLKFSLVTIPIRLYPAINTAATIKFHQLHRECQTRIQYRKWCPTCDREVTADEIVRGYEFERGRYVALEEKEIQRVRPESTHTINLTQFVDGSAIDPILIDQPYFLAPDGKAAGETFAVVREALKGKAAIGSVTLHGRERLAAVEPREKGFVLFTLRHEEEVRDIGKIPELADAAAHVPPDALQLAKQVIGRIAPRINFAKYHDTYEEALREMIDARIAGEDIVTAAAKPRATPVVNLMDALRKSLAEAVPKRRPAKSGRKPSTRKTRVVRFPERRHA
jgi:DNA end-binding protein Ku